MYIVVRGVFSSAVSVFWLSFLRRRAAGRLCVSARFSAVGEMRGFPGICRAKEGRAWEFRILSFAVIVYNGAVVCVLRGVV